MAKHALLSPSASSRWINCPASLKLEQAFPESPSSSFAQEGTRAHALAEDRLRNYLDPSYSIQALPDDEEMDEMVEAYVNYVKELYNEALASTSDARLFIEKRLSFDPMIPKSFGTADAVIVSDDKLHIVDLKYGKGVAVFAEQNTQLIIYAYGALNLYGALYDFKEVVVHIVQPRKNSFTSCAYTVDEIQEEIKYISEQAFKALKGCDEFKAGSWCRWCKLNPTCRKKAEQLQAQKEALENAVLSLDEIAEILPSLDEFVTWAKDLKDYATEQAISGQTLKGFKLVEGRTQRKVSNSKGLVEALVKEGYDETSLYKPAELLGLQALEKLIGAKRLATLAGQFITKPHGRPTLVPASDPRREYNPALDDFAEELKGK